MPKEAVVGAISFERNIGSAYLYEEPLKVESLGIIGPVEVVENSQAQYRAIAVYDNNSTRDITDSVNCVWFVEPNSNCSIAAGLLTTEMIDLPTVITIIAQYSEGDVNESAEKEVSIFAICPRGSALDFGGDRDYVEIAKDTSISLLPKF